MCMIIFLSVLVGSLTLGALYLVERHFENWRKICATKQSLRENQNVYITAGSLALGISGLALGSAIFLTPLVVVSENHWSVFVALSITAPIFFVCILSAFSLFLLQKVVSALGACAGMILLIALLELSGAILIFFGILFGIFFITRN